MTQSPVQSDRGTGMDFHINLQGRRNLSGEIYRQLRQAIVDGRLRPGALLPPTRHLAERLSVARMTVTVAYDRLVAEGFVLSRVGAGTFVSDEAGRHHLSAAPKSDGVLQPRSVWNAIELPTVFASPAAYDFRTGLPEAAWFPHRVWRRLLGRSMRVPEVAGGVYQDSAGLPQLRAAIANHIAISRGVNAGSDEVIVTNGTQQALDLITRVLLAPGDAIAVEDPGYQPPRRLFTSCGIRVVGVAVDEERLVVDALPRRVRAVYVTPSHQYPLGVPMSLRRRQALLAWAERQRAAIIEDDYDSEFRFTGRPLEALQSLDVGGRVLYVGSFSKTLLPTLRVGFIVSPPSLHPALRRAKFVSDWHTSSLVQAALAQFIETGAYARHIRRVNGRYRERHALITRILSRDFADHLELVPSSTGLHVTAFARRLSTQQLDAVQARAAERDVAVRVLSRLFVGKPTRAGLVLGYGAIDVTDIPEGLRRLRRCFPA
jgi:GntR family transcriptional regulator / MocR family aminotransferase